MTNYNVTIEEYRALADKLYTKEMTWEEFDKYNIVLPVAPSHANEFVNKLINNTCVNYSKNGDKTLYSGSSSKLSWDTMEENDFKRVAEWSDYYREVFVSDIDMVTVTTCEGDISITLHDTPESYDNYIVECKEFYKEN